MRGGSSSDRPSPKAVRIAAACLAVILVVIIGLIHLFSGLSYTDPGNIGIVRNGGMFDNTQIRTNDDGSPETVPPASSYTWIGAHSTLREYPIVAKYWTIDRDGGDTNQAVDVPTRDGINVGVQGQFTFALNQDPAVLADFDNRFGSRSFGASGYRPSDGTVEGFNDFLSAYMPVAVNNVLRQEVGTVNCRDLIASCALVQNGSAAAQVDPNANTQATIIGIQDKVNAQFEQVINSQLGGPFLTHVSLSLGTISLPDDLQGRVQQAQGAFAAVSEAQARVQQAQADAQANQTRQQGYVSCPICGQIDIMRALPPGVTTYAPGSPVAVGGGR